VSFVCRSLSLSLLAPLSLAPLCVPVCLVHNLSLTMHATYIHARMCVGARGYRDGDGGGGTASEAAGCGHVKRLKVLTHNPYPLLCKPTHKHTCAGAHVYAANTAVTPSVSHTHVPAQHRGDEGRRVVDGDAVVCAARGRDAKQGRATFNLRNLENSLLDLGHAWRVAV